MKPLSLTEEVLNGIDDDESSIGEHMSLTEYVLNGGMPNDTAESESASDAKGYFQENLERKGGG